MLTDQQTAAPHFNAEFQSAILSELAEVKRALNIILGKDAHKPPMFYSVEDTCKMLGNISRSTLVDYTDKQIIVAHRLGGRVLYKESDIEAAAKKINNRAKKAA